MIEWCKAKLHGTGIVEASLRLEIDVQSLGQRFKTLHPLWAVKEGWSPRDEQIQIWKTPTVDIVDQLPKGIESLLSHVRPHTLQSLNFVENKDQSRVAANPSKSTTGHARS